MYTWDVLGTLSGATAATLLIVQYLKVPLDRLMCIRTRIVVLVVAFLILMAGKAFSGGTIVWSDVPLLLVNAFFVGLAAMGAYENTFALMENEAG